MNEVEQAWEEYRKALEKCAIETKLAAFYTEEAAKATEKASQLTLLAVYHVREYIKEARAIQEALKGR